MPALIPFLVFLVIGYFLILRPRQASMRQRQELIESLAVGDAVITAGGIHGTITATAEETVQIEVAPGVVLTLARLAIGRRVDPAAADHENGAGDAGAEVEDDVDQVSSEPGESRELGGAA